MDIKSLVGDIESILNPKVTYKGSFFLISYLFTAASKKENGENLIEKFFFKKYLVNIYDDYESFYNSARIPIFFQATISKDGYGRELIPTSSLFMKDFITSLFKYNFNIDEENEEKIHEEVKEVLKEMKNCINAILSGKSKLEDNEVLSNAYIKNKNGIRKNLQDLEKNSKDIKLKLNIRTILNNEEKLKTYSLKAIKTTTVTTLIYYDSMIKELSKPLNLDDLDNLINYDDFYLLLAKIYIRNVELVLNSCGELPSLVMFLYKYYNALKQLKNYYYKTDISDILLVGETKTTYSTKDFITDFEKIVLPIKDPEIRYYQIMEQDNTINYRDINNVNKKIEELKDIDASRELAVGWDFVPKGELLEPREKSISSSGRSFKKVDLVSREERLEEVLKRQQFLDNTPYIYKAQGKNKFDGYVAYIYGNGYVLFEKFYENLKTMLPSKSNATYVMTTDNFVEMSKLSKTEIIEYIKDGNTDVARKNHTSSWENNILNIINSSFYSKEIVDKIDRLITLGKIEERKLDKKYE